MKRPQPKAERSETPEAKPQENRPLYRERTVVLVDALSLYYGALQLNIKIDYGLLLQYLAKDSQLVHALFYTGFDLVKRLTLPARSVSSAFKTPFKRRRPQQPLESEVEANQQFLDWLRQQGYRVITKAVQQFPDGSQKLDLDVEIAIDMMKLSESCDRMILVSGDDTLAYAVRRVSDRGIRSQVVSLRDMTSERLLEAADDYCDLYTIREQIQLK